MNLAEYTQILDVYQEWQDYLAAAGRLNTGLSQYGAGSTARIVVTFRDAQGNESGEIEVCTHEDKIDGRALAVELRNKVVEGRDSSKDDFDEFTGTAV
jgi:hypothetical protein